MYHQFKTSLFHPKRIIMFLNNSYVKLWVYFFLLMFILTIPTILLTFKFDTMAPHDIQTMELGYKDYFKGSAKIENGLLYIEDSYNKSYTFGMYQISMSHQFIRSEAVIHIEFQEDRIRVHILNIFKYDQTYFDLGFDEFDFNDYSTKNIEHFTTLMLKTLKPIEVHTKILYVFIEFIKYSIEALMLIILSTFLTRLPLPFKYKFKGGVYASTIYVILCFFGIVFNMAILNLLGIIMLIVNYNIFIRGLKGHGI
ncbi:hypothetical protein [Acholeplasma equifetale]|uniref:hypothetical protein n=1 Tax=Acholeplasma equifetale TaxID=264634 RepID=UPI00047BEA52|nr:hypothetical protein [Acholeplasma equifetale]